MLATIMPFLCMGAGLFIGSRRLSEKTYKAVDWITNLSLIVLMVTIGGNVGTNEEVIAEIGTVGLNCLITCLSAIIGSVAFCLIAEKTVIPLRNYSQSQIDDNIEKSMPEKIQEETGAGVAAAEREAEQEIGELKIETEAAAVEKKGIDPILILIPVSVLSGAFGCYFFLPQDQAFVLNYTLWGSLVVLYLSVGIGMGRNKGILAYLRRLGFRIIYLILGIYLGSIAGGAISAAFTGMPLSYAVIAASGSGYYSVTGATMLSVFGAEAGVYGFMINVFRDFFTVILLPVLGKISCSAPIASGGAGNMDSMLVPVTKVVGRELGVVTLIVGVVLTFTVPLMLPVLCSLLG